jgi:hypothetical protein
MTLMAGRMRLASTTCRIVHYLLGSTSYYSCYMTDHCSVQSTPSLAHVESMLCVILCLVLAVATLMLRRCAVR